MKTGSKIFLIFLACLSTACIHSGFDWNLPKFAVVETTAVGNILDDTASAGGNITDDGGSPVTERGVCLSIQVSPTIEDTVVVCGKEIGTFTATLHGLKALTTYYLRAYATTRAGTAYGNETTFTTLGLASLTTSPVGSVTLTSAVCGGNVTSGGGADVVERGICFSTSKAPTTASKTIAAGSGLGDFSIVINDLTTNTTYYVRAYSINIIGTTYGNEVSFTTASLPTLTTVSASQITQTGARSGGGITNAGSSAVSERGVCFGPTSNPSLSNGVVISGTGTGNFTSTITGLIPGMSYFVRAFATNSSGTAYGNEVSFTTLPELKLGQSYQGGLIFYLDDTTLHGLIASTYDQSVGAAWGCSGTLIPGSQGLVQGTGLANTNAIVTDCTTTGIAAKICADLVTGGYSDWYLPSRDELSLIYDNLKLKGLGGFSNSNYWSSSEYSSTSSYIQSFSSGVVGQLAKSSSARVRAIRTF